MINRINYKKIRAYLIAISLITLIAFFYRLFNLDYISDLIQASQNNLELFIFIAPFIILFLRSISIIIPLIPGTYCSVASGYIFGIEKGLLIIFCADFISCSCCFFLSRKLGRNFVRNLLGKSQIQRIEGISQKYLENNFFLMTGFLMTQFFDFVCYGIGLTKVSWRKFMPALVLSILVSDIPFVAGGYAIKNLKNVELIEILNGNVRSVQGPYLIAFLVSILTIFALGFLNQFMIRFNSVSKR